MEKNTSHKSFLEFFTSNPGQCLKWTKILGTEVPLYPASKMLSRDFIENYLSSGQIPRSGNCIGKIDVIFKSGGFAYVGEVKYYSFSDGEFWDALKILGYSVYFNWTNDSGSRYKPAILMPLNKIKLEHQIVVGRLGITLFGILEEDGLFSIKKIGDTPIWKQ